MTNAAAPDTKAALLARIRADRAALEATLARLDEAALTRPAADGWSIKDHLFHIAAWLAKTMAGLQDRPGQDALGVPNTVFDAGDDDSVNVLLQQHGQSRPLAEVLSQFRTTHVDALRFLETLPEARLNTPYNPADPSDTRRAIDAIAGNTYEHDEEHRGWIEQRLRAEG